MATVGSGLSGHILVKGSRLLHRLWCPTFVLSLTVITASVVHVNSLVSSVWTDLMLYRTASKGLQACGCCRTGYVRVVLCLWKD